MLERERFYRQAKKTMPVSLLPFFIKYFGCKTNKTPPPCNPQKFDSWSFLHKIVNYL